MSIVCPCCGSDLPMQRASIEMLTHARVSPQQRIVLKALAEVYPDERATDELVNVLYGKRWDGGPEDPRRMIRAVIGHLRAILPAYGWTIPNYRGGKGNKGRFRLEPSGAEKARA